MAIALPNRDDQHRSIRFEADGLVFEGFREASPEVVALVRDAADPEQAAHDCLEVGARALRTAQVTIDTAVVEKAFGEMSDDLGRAVEDVARRIDETAHGLLDEDEGALKVALSQFTDDVSNLLGETFDPDSKRSVLAKLDALMADAAERQVRSVRALMNPDVEESPLHRWRADILRAVSEQGSTVQRAVNELAERLAVKQAQAEVLERTAVKGFDFEDALVEALERIATPLGDVPEHVGDRAGMEAGKTGDVVVELSHDATNGLDARYVLECKDRRLPLRGALLELEQAMRNRDALAGVMVFSRAENAPIPSEFQDFGDRAIVVLDKDELDDRALRLACMWARWVVRRALAGGDDGPDVERMRQLLQNAQRALGTASNVRRCHTQARKGLDEAAAGLDALVAGVDAALGAIASELERSPGPQASSSQGMLA